MKPLISIVCLLAAAGCASQSDPDAQRRSYATTHPQPEDTQTKNNTAANKRDYVDESQPTPVDQGTSEFDVGRTADIRKRIVGTDLSVTAKNVKVITRDGRVTLRGLVTTQAEKDTIDGIARDVAGADNVDDRLDVETGH